MTQAPGTPWGGYRVTSASPFVGQGEMAARMAAFDWASTPLGPASRWPQSLRTAVGICLSSRHPMVIWWGSHLALLYNDACVPILGPDKHPALGVPGMAVWRERLFAAMHLNANVPAAYFGVPIGQVVEMGLEVEI